MTFRAKPVVKRAHRPAWETQDRRNFYLNIGFGIVVVVGIAMLLIAAGLNYYNEHLASVGSVNGQSITKDDLRDRVAVDSWRLTETGRRISTAVAAGQLTQAQGSQQQQSITSALGQIQTVSLERLIDATLQSQLAGEEGVTATPEEIDAQFTKDATTPEERHIWMIEVKPVTDPGAVQPTQAQADEARAKADAALADLASGKAWEDVAKTVSTESSSAPLGGDLGWARADATQSDESFLKAVFAAKVNEPTAVIVGADGAYRIGRVTEIAPESVDAQYQTTLVNDGVTLDQYRKVLAADVIHANLQAKLVAGLTGAAPQRQVQEIYAKEPAPDLGADAIKTRHILYSPNGDPTNASSLSADDPAWEIARQQALAAYVRLQANPEVFDSIARTESDETAAQGPTGTGGKLPYFDSQSQVDAAFLAAILVPGLKDGQILEPVKSGFGWHVIQVMYHPTDEAHFQMLKQEADSGADFAILARDNSEAPTAGTGGDLGWVAKGQLDDKLTAAIFATPIGQTSDVVAVSGDGTYLFKVTAEETRTPEGRQLDELTSTAFTKWYDAKKAAADIQRADSSVPTTLN